MRSGSVPRSKAYLLVRTGVRALFWGALLLAVLGATYEGAHYLDQHTKKVRCTHSLDVTVCQTEWK